MLGDPALDDDVVGVILYLISHARSMTRKDERTIEHWIRVHHQLVQLLIHAIGN